MPIILASIVLAVALAALPSTEPPDEGEQKAYEHLIAMEREKRRSKVLSRELIRNDEQGQELRMERSKSYVNKSADELGVAPSSSKSALEWQPPSTSTATDRGQSSLPRSSRLVSGTQLSSVHSLFESHTNSHVLSQSQSQYQLHVRPEDPQSYARNHGHVRRSSSVPSFRSCTSNASWSGTSSTHSSPATSPKIGHTTIL